MKLFGYIRIAVQNLHNNNMCCIVVCIRHFRILRILIRDIGICIIHNTVSEVFLHRIKFT